MDNWSGRDEFVRQEKKPFIVNNKTAGMEKYANLGKLLAYGPKGKVLVGNLYRMDTICRLGSMNILGNTGNICFTWLVNFHLY